MHKEKTLVIGHRGAAALCPENTLASFHLAFDEHQCDMIEFDLHISADGVPVIIHDDTLERTTDGQGKVAEQTLQQLKIRDAGFHFDPLHDQSFPFRGQGLTIPTLDEVFEHFPDKRLALEIKSQTDETVKQIFKVIAKHNAYDRVVVGSLHDSVYHKLIALKPNCKIFTSKNEAQRLYMQFILGLGKKKKRPGLVASLPVKTNFLDLKTKKWIDWLKQKEITVYYWTVNDTGLMRALAERGADGIMSDNPKLILESI